MKYYSHILYFPDAYPFDNTNYRWQSFVGEFVRPIVEDIPDLYWFSYYTVRAHLRIYTDEYDRIRPKLELLRDQLGLIDKGEEKDMTLERDLGSDRFLSSERTDKNNTDRALLILKLLNAGCKLYMDTLVKDGKYWREEINKDINQNPFHSSSYSYIHLLHNLCKSDLLVYLYHDKNQLQILSHYYFGEAIHQGLISPQKVERHRIQA